MTRSLAAIAGLAVVLSVHLAFAQTVVLIAPPPALETAVRSSLAPWKIDVVVVAAGASTPEALAAAQDAGFVAWRDGGDLVFWDTARSIRERRPMARNLDEAGAAALALSIKTWMRLPASPPPPDEIQPPPPPPDGGGGPVITGPVVVTPMPAPRPLLRLEASSGVRTNLGDQGSTGLRFAAAALTRAGPVDVGLAIELGLSSAVTSGTADGDWSSTQVMGRGRWPVPIGAFVVAPMVGLGFVHSSYAGTGGPQGQAFEASATSFAVETAVGAEWRRGHFAIGLDLGLTTIASQQLHDRSVQVDPATHVEPRGLVSAAVSLP